MGEVKNATELAFPIAEKFVSPQGEGVWTGTMMAFIRLAGCTVGKRFPKERYEKLPHCEFKCEGGDPDIGHGPKCAYAKSTHALLPIYTEKCTLWDGREFACDTDYRMKEKSTIEELMSWVPNNIKHICVTGGEPLMHGNKLYLFYSRSVDGSLIHIETSGTIGLPEKLLAIREELWITVAPKLGALPEMIKDADEVKLLVDENFDVSKVPQAVFDHDTVFIQPVNYEYHINRENLKKVMELQKRFPQWRVSLQLHKILSDYLEELVR